MKLHLEMSNGAAMVRGSFLGQGASECRSVSFVFTSDVYGAQGLDSSSTLRYSPALNSLKYSALVNLPCGEGVFTLAQRCHAPLQLPDA